MDTDLADELSDSDWLQLLQSDWQLIADVTFADLVLWMPGPEGFYAAAHARPSSAATLFYRDITGSAPRADWRAVLEAAASSGKTTKQPGNVSFEGAPTRLVAIPVRRRMAGAITEPIAVVTRHTNLAESRTPTKLALNYLACGTELLEMVASGDFPLLDGQGSSKRGAPRANDGLIRLDAQGQVIFASPNALSIFNRAGVKGELEGKLLSKAVTPAIPALSTVDENLSLVLTGKGAWRADLEAKDVVLALRSIPLRSSGSKTGAIILCREVTSLRDRERELINKDLTIREIHHRVKNNLQTVASLLRMQSRTTKSEEVKESLGQAMRRVSAIAVVHDVLSEGIDQAVDFDQIFKRILMLVAELAASYHTIVKTELEGKFGTLTAEQSTALALVLTEVVTNAVEHGLKDRSGTVRVQVRRERGQLEIEVTDDGTGLAEGKVGTGLGTQIIRSLVESELRGKIAWTSPIRGGTRVSLAIPA